MSFLWDSLRDVVVNTGSSLGNAAGKGALLAKIKADLMFLDRELLARKGRFGVEMYDYVAPLSKSQSFYTSDDTLTLTLQPPLITAQREIAALEIKRAKQQEKIQQAAQVRASTFTRPAENWTDMLANAGKSAALGGNEAKLSTELSMYNGQVQHFKQEFGVSLYNTLEELEDSKQWLPTDREIRSIYDNCRRDVEKIQQRKVAKQAELKTVQNGGVEEYAGPQITTTSGNNNQRPPEFNIQTQGAQPSVYAKEEAMTPNYDMYGATMAAANAHNAYPATAYPAAATHQQPSSMYPNQQQQHYPAPAAQPPHQMMQQPPQQQSAPVLHSNLFAGVVPGSAPIPQQQQQPAFSQGQQDPFGSFNNSGGGMMGQPQQQQQQQPHDPFANDPFANDLFATNNQPANNDPFANNNHTNAFAAQPIAATTATTGVSDGYQDPFSGL